MTPPKSPDPSLPVGKKITTPKARLIQAFHKISRDPQRLKVLKQERKKCFFSQDCESRCKEHNRKQRCLGLGLSIGSFIIMINCFHLFLSNCTIYIHCHMPSNSNLYSLSPLRSSLLGLGLDTEDRLLAQGAHLVMRDGGRCKYSSGKVRSHFDTFLALSIGYREATSQK